MSTNEEIMKPILDNITYIVKLGLDKLSNDLIISQLKNDKEKYKLEVERYKLEVQRCKLEMKHYTLDIDHYKLKIENFELKLKKLTKKYQKKKNKKTRLFTDNVIDLTSDEVEIKVEKISKPHKIENIVLKIEENTIKEENVEIVSIILETIENKIVQMNNEEDETEEEEEEEAEEEELEEEEEAEQEVDEAEEEEEEVFEIEIAYKKYFTNNEENGIIYTKDENDEPGNQIGYYKDGEIFFY